MKLSELKTGDIVVVRYGLRGVVIRDGSNEYILYQDSGCDFFWDFNEDMTWEYDEEEWDIMRVYRDYFNGVITFIDFEDAYLIYERDSSWVMPTEEEMKAKAEAARIEQERLEEERRKKAAESAGNKEDNYIRILAQAFYGNRTVTEIDKANLDTFIMGILDPELTRPKGEIDRTVVKVPGTDNVVMIYNKYEEEKCLAYGRELAEEGRTIKPLAFIPEEGIEIYSRCIVCRMNEDGELESLQYEDLDKCLEYLAE